MADSDNPLTPEEEIRRAGKAREILENPVFKDAVGLIEAALLDAIHRSAFADEKLREKLCQRFALLRDLESELQSVMTTGKIAAIQIEERSRFREFSDRVRNKVGL